MYRIGEFSKITQLSTKTLRYYDEEGMLSPTYRDQETGYRYYQETDFERAELIRLLRSFEFSIMEIKDVIATMQEPKDLSCYLFEKQVHIEHEIKEKQKLIQQMEAFMKPKQSSQEKHPYAITQVSQNAQLVATMTYQGRYQDMGKYLSKMYKDIKGNLANTPVFNLYFDDDFQEQANIEICIPIKHEYPSTYCTIKTIPAYRGISTTHVGCYEDLHYAYKAILDEAYQQSLFLYTPSFEIYHKGPGKLFKGNPDTYVTQIIIPIKEDNNHA